MGGTRGSIIERKTRVFTWSFWITAGATALIGVAIMLHVAVQTEGLLAPPPTRYPLTVLKHEDLSRLIADTEMRLMKWIAGALNQQEYPVQDKQKHSELDFCGLFLL